MAIVQVKYFNSFWLKKAVNKEDISSRPAYPYTKFLIGTSYVRGDYKLWLDPTTPAVVPIEDGVNEYFVCIKDATHAASHQITPPFSPDYWLRIKSRRPAWPGLPWNPADYPTFPADCTLTSSKNWIIEESRIRGGYNNTSTDYGVKAYLVEDDNDQSILDNKLIYSGVYNSTTSFNETNVFSVAENITKSLDPANGSIQKIYAENTNLIILQENKISGALIDKDAIYSAEGQPITTSSQKEVIGQITPYLGEYGISKDPDSFAVFGFRKYFTDRYRNAVLRLSRDGITEISEYGMRDYFRDQLGEISDVWKNYTTTYTYGNSHGGSAPPVANDPYWVLLNVAPSDIEVGMIISIPQAAPVTKPVNSIVLGVFRNKVYIQNDPLTPATDGTITFSKFVKDRIVGGYDNYNKSYTLSMQSAITSPTEVESFLPLDSGGNTQTLMFDEEPKGWTSFYTYRPLFIDSIRNAFFTTKDSDLWRHYDNSLPNRTSFYDVQSDSSITFVFNVNPSINKNFNTINYEGSNGWQVNSILSGDQGRDLIGTWVNKQDEASVVKSYEEGKYTDGGVIYRSGFNRKENRYVANLVNNSTQKIGEVVFGDQMSGIKGYYVTVKMSLDTTTDPGGMKELFAVSSNFVVSSY